MRRRVSRIIFASVVNASRRRRRGLVHALHLLTYLLTYLIKDGLTNMRLRWSIDTVRRLSSAGARAHYEVDHAASKQRQPDAARFDSYRREW